MQGTEGGTITGYYSQDSIINQGTIDADTSGQTITVSGSNWSNTGLLEATNSGTLNITGSWNNTGTIIENNGTLDLGGTFHRGGSGDGQPHGRDDEYDGDADQHRHGADLDTTTGSLNLAGGTITGGTISGNTSQLTVSSGTLNGVTLGANLTVPNGVSLYVKNGLTLNNANVTLNSTGSYDLSSTSRGRRRWAGPGRSCSVEAIR